MVHAGSLSAKLRATHAECKPALAVFSSRSADGLAAKRAACGTASPGSRVGDQPACALGSRPSRVPELHRSVLVSLRER